MICLAQATGVVARGTVFRLPGEYPHEQVVDLLLVECPDLERPYRLVVATGHKAGLPLVVLPVPFGTALTFEWLRDNWQHWVYPSCTPAEVAVTAYPPPCLS